MESRGAEITGNQTWHRQTTFWKFTFMVAFLLVLGGPALFLVLELLLQVQCAPGPNHPPYGYCDGWGLLLILLGIPTVAGSVIVGLAMLALLSRSRKR